MQHNLCKAMLLMMQNCSYLKLFVLAIFEDKNVYILKGIFLGWKDFNWIQSFLDKKGQTLEQFLNSKFVSSLNATLLCILTVALQISILKHQLFDCWKENSCFTTYNCVHIYMVNVLCPQNTDMLSANGHSFLHPKK